jgi:hypothetical protein
MTGLICELSQEQAREQEQSLKLENNGACKITSAPDRESLLAAKENDQLHVSENVLGHRESSPVRRLKRSRASISATAAADVMAVQAAKILSTASPVKVASGHLENAKSSDSSDSTEEEDDSLALRVRRAQAFESGALAANSPAEVAVQSPLSARQGGKMSPRSQLAFDRGARAAQVAAKVAAAMLP